MIIYLFFSLPIVLFLSSTSLAPILHYETS